MPELAIRPIDLQRIKSLLDSHLPGVRVVAFGSRATGKSWQWSDIDLLVLGGKPIGWSKLSELKEAFEESDLPIRVDLVDAQSADPEFVRSVLADSVQIAP